MVKCDKYLNQLYLYLSDVFIQQRLVKQITFNINY